MANSILQSFLDNRFIKTDVPEHIANLEKAVTEVQKQLSKKKTKIIGYTLVALDPTISDNDPIVAEVEAIIIKQWPTFKNSVVKSKDTPIAYIQAVILEALKKLSEHENLAAIIWHTGCKIISYYKLAGHQKILTNFLLEIGEKVEEIGRKNWSIIENTQIESIKPFELNLPTTSKAQVRPDEFQKHLKAAAVHSAWAEQAGGGENPAHSATGNHVWPQFFAERAALGLSQEINSALDTQDKSIVDISTSIKQSIDTYFANLEPYMGQVSFSILQSCQSLIKRNNLIWWKQSLYSPKLNSSYRTLCPLALSMAMAVDLADSVYPIHPQSVIFFLKETLRDVLDDKSETEDTMVQILVQLQKLSDAEKRLLKDLSYENEGRISLGACLAHIMGDSLSAEELFERTGLEKNAKISFSELSVWLFHDLQAIKLAKEK